MPTNVIATSNKNLSAYPELLKRVREAIRAGKERAFVAVERESVRTKWKVGRLIQEHILLNKERAEYGKRVLERLSRDLSVSNTELYYMVEFAKANPIFRLAGKLSWGHHEALLRINDDEKRLKLTREAAQKKWTRETLRSEINRREAAKQITVTPAPAAKLLEAKKGVPYTYNIEAGEESPEIDLGFSCYYELSKADQKKFKAGQRVQSTLTHSAKGYRLSKVTSPEILPFTYHARVLDVTDADTIWMKIDLGFGMKTKQQLRLRGIDAAEMTTREGQEAKRFVERELKAGAGLKPAPTIIITSTKSDKYDRYLADVFYTVAGRERFLNNRLLEAGLAERM